MATDNLKTAVIAALDHVGRVRTLEIAPELASLEGWTNESLAGVMTDANDIICDEKHQENLLFLMEFFCSTEAAQNERKLHFDMVTNSLAATLRYQPTTVGIDYSSGNTPKSITAALMADATKDYVPVVGVVVGKEKGPFKAALESMFNLLYRGTAPPLLASRFATSVLRLWREVLQTWIQTTLERENSPEFEIVEPTAAVPVTRANAQKGTVPINLAQPARAQGIKRSRSVKEQGPPPRPHKRKAIPPPPSTPTVEGLANGHTPPHVQLQFIPTLIEAIPSHSTPSSESGVDAMYTFRRDEFSKHFGSGSQELETSWVRQPKYEKHRPPGAGSLRLIGGNIKFNPYFPQTPCARGLVYRAPGFNYKFDNEGDAEPCTHTVLFQLAETKWLYLGEYVVKYKCSLPLAEWESSTTEVSSNDLAVVMAYGQFFFLRKFKDEWVKHITGGPYRYAGPQVPPLEMRQSLDAGTLKLEVYEMKCVDYHVALQAKIIELALDRNHTKEKRTCCA